MPQTMTAVIEQRSDTDALPEDVQIELVTALFDDARSLVVGTVASFAAALVTVVRTGEPLVALAMLLVVCVALIRLRDTRRFAVARLAVRTAADAQPWERRYAMLAVIHVASLGFWCATALTMSDDAVVHLLSLSLNICYLIGISGRNFASGRLVDWQIMAAAAPLAGALAWRGGAYLLILLLVFLPFFISIRTIAARLRRILVEAVLRERDNRVLANRFDTALNNMPVGLAMFDAAGRLVVGNHRLGQLFGITLRDIGRDHGLPALIDLIRVAGTIAPVSAPRMLADLSARLTGTGIGKLTWDLEGARTVEVNAHPMASGGAVVLVEDITDRRKAEMEINRLASFDVLTGLPNRLELRRRFDRVLARLGLDAFAALHFLDLDNFKQVNDTLGHPVGDALLVAVAERLRQGMRASDIVARLGGDEFVIVQWPVTMAEEACALAERVIKELCRPFMIDGHELSVGASVGIAFASSAQADIDVLMQQADMALYAAKADGKSTWRSFAREMDQKAQARRVIETDLRRALENGDFALHYQPIVDIASRDVRTCEALLRWPHPERGMISPLEFIPVAEDLGLIVELGGFVMREAARTCATWPGTTRVAVNLSPTQFRRSHVASVVREALTLGGLAPDRLEIEITEATLMQDTETTRACLDQLKDLGVRLSLDDFGTGYSSLSYLQMFPFDKVKIDRSFLRDIHTNARAQTLLRSIARLARELGLEVVIEGVETAHELDWITRETVIGEAQGFYFARPRPAAEIATLLRAGLNAQTGRAA
jgi:diguanylate cyclase (GGDEF)-like protein